MNDETPPLATEEPLLTEDCYVDSNGRVFTSDNLPHNIGAASRYMQVASNQEPDFAAWHRTQKPPAREHPLDAAFRRLEEQKQSTKDR
jgi:hypothetical protein